MASNPFNVGIHAAEIYIPKKFVNQTELEQFDGASAGKYTIGLGQQNMAICDDREDINSICLTAVNNLLDKYEINPASIGFLEVGTETIIDKSKSVKSVLMQLFASAGNTNIEGIDCKNACYGGTNALFAAINWLESGYVEEGKEWAIVVAADIAVYKSGSARPTGGAGAVAMLLGRHAPLVFDRAMRSTFMEHVWDFYKPDLHSEYPEVDGPLSNMCYIKAIDKCYEGYLERVAKKEGASAKLNMDVGDYFLFHCPYSKLVQKSFGRLAFNDYLRNPSAFPAIPDSIKEHPNLTRESTYTDKNVEKVFMEVVKAQQKAKVDPGLLASRNVGNMYCGSLYSGLVSVLSEVTAEELVAKRLVLFSYGSGLSSSMFSITVQQGQATIDTLNRIRSNLRVADRLQARTKIEPKVYDEIMALRQGVHNAKEYTPVSSNKDMFPGTWYLVDIDGMFRRKYARVGFGGDDMEITPPMTPTL
ncbi:hydroxymethylglutaryl-coenzyme A synthase C terminal-domain-containing protein [Chytriomyces sp. MP71]|nr:hydroxymethylglutaryl-coenzyme A synthase C terminal-domain-containing protein [Chytriomyces sp. MP71]